MLRKETTTRRFLENGKDWHDTTSIEPLTEINTNPYARTEYGGPKGAEPTRFGTWESEGREIYRLFLSIILVISEAQFTKVKVQQMSKMVRFRIGN